MPWIGTDRAVHRTECPHRAFASSPDGNSVNIQFIRPTDGKILPCVYYIHGGGMATMSCYTASTAPGAGSSPRKASPWRWSISATRSRVLGARSRALSGRPERLCLGPEVGPRQRGEAGHRSSRIIVAGESGGGNLTLATGLKLNKDGDLGLIKGLYALCPYIAGEWPQTQYPSSTENNGILLNLHNNRGAMAYGIEAFRARDPLAWPALPRPKTSRACRRW